MKTLKLTIDRTLLNLNEQDSQKSNAEIVSTVIENVILAYGQQQRGFDEKERRQYYKIADAFDVAKKSKAEQMELEDDWLGLIRKCFRESKLMPNILLKQVEVILSEIRND